jgi:hypothetical protein
VAAKEKTAARLPHSKQNIPNAFITARVNAVQGKYSEGSRGCNGFRMFSRNKTAGDGRTNMKRRVQARSLGMFFVGIAVAMTLSPAYSEKATHKVWSVDWEQFWPRELSGEAQ